MPAVRRLYNLAPVILVALSLLLAIVTVAKVICQC